MKEIWKTINGNYSVSNYGNVKSIRNNAIIKPGNNGHGYLFVYLWNKGDKKRWYIHRLVATMFIDNPNGLKEINHKDCDKSNNQVDNLEWTTREENIKHGVKNNRYHTSEYQKKQTSLSNRGEGANFSKLNSDKVVKIRKLYLEGFTQQEIGKLFNVGRANIGYIVTRKSWKHI